MLPNSSIYRGCTIIKKARGREFLIQFPSGDWALIKDATSFKDCETWIDRQLARLAILKVVGGK
ncbi:MAG: hypothetical protein JGK03_15600 [Microcoleus sp. PH2017_25_DOB_D_A]|uniref:hypothetical protein n=1 Tax=unclassified Microcoleus TaxID=2642155 RepID=UPI001DD592F8|nr:MULTISPECIES: hypothetical protein [unclassified Microcoleus]MCC3535597.1 hypothetical protein [Microcoleus sp. PH2017_25_DOB_D_A]MCC3545434.1 hypothetical protein [Microcoleus sp. PH2017_24_DOB_U_A]